ncbi:DNA-binding transcriptional response regulator, NtrC family, contains REC, AAA-type ATPase, and a Fis-type DNA-binding domains [Mucilaginibacter mallensis]|uniref:DNA-binding transcriptional response regulator, NtrC family, contains REC, AAA-type ATPase, and a Fis-type DNA-binding domains n=1 Tax=Mucilaginibacter mallensis TaxID=652787 RepID=A0A1H2BMS1_MUCMA|nr:sigma-54 dependent transcriptional regulator [Mucilaginibacter mallensis]SDT59531.1 DNA-binding transcriptional response regulator, NtrC family, contains REC, AAA-type ATPase, and a Fis-type DNA-binding domains [Mucilaginibacter mallensis]
MSKGKLLVIDDEERLRKLLARILQLEDFEVLEAANAKDGLRKLDHEVVDVVISDVKLPDANGIELTKTIKASYPAIEIIVLTAYGTINDGVTAIKNGAFDYITKGDDNEKIIPLVNKAMDKAILQRRVLELESKLNNKFGFDRIIGTSPAITAAIKLAQRVATTDTTVMILGETGTGKEVFAEAIHQASPRSNKPFVAINCSAFSKELLESELFGHKAGAFTGAVKDKKGLFEEANGGTIFLDELGELDHDLQAKLLRVLESQQFIKLGDTKTTKVNVRILAATNRNLQDEVAKEHFRSDLFYRLSVFQIMLPAIRDRKQDIGPIAKSFVQYFAAKVNKQITGFTDDFLHKLEVYNWPGNVRELKNIIERAVILCDTHELDASLLPYEFDSAPAKSNGNLSAFDLSSVEKLHIQRVLNHTQSNRAEAARLLNIGIATLYRKLKEYGLE